MTALKVIIDEQQGELSNVDARSGKTAAGRDWSMRSQKIWVYEQGAKFPLKVQLNLPDGVQVHPAGDYTLDLNKAFITGNFDAIELDTRKIQLVPVLPSRSPAKQ